MMRDARVIEQLKELGWNVVVIWECETKDPKKLAEIIRKRIIKKKFGLSRKTRDRALLSTRQPVPTAA